MPLKSKAIWKQIWTYEFCFIFIYASSHPSYHKITKTYSCKYRILFSKHGRPWTILNFTVCFTLYMRASTIFYNVFFFKCRLSCIINIRSTYVLRALLLKCVKFLIIFILFWKKMRLLWAICRAICSEFVGFNLTQTSHLTPHHISV